MSGQRSFLESDKAATISPDGLYRYVLRRGASPCSDDVVNFVMLNPSTADAEQPDPTTTRCVGFARAWGYGDLIITNLYALRSTDPKGLRSHPDPVGPENDRHVADAARRASCVVCAWGADPMVARRAPGVLRMFAGLGIRPHVLALTRRGHPIHPLYQPSGSLAVEWESGSYLLSTGR